jgi:hypothetical protein
VGDDYAPEDRRGLHLICAAAGVLRECPMTTSNGHTNAFLNSELRPAFSATHFDAGPAARSRFSPTGADQLPTHNAPLRGCVQGERQVARGTGAQIRASRPMSNALTADEIRLCFTFK